MKYSILEPSEASKIYSFSFWQSYVWQKILIDSKQAQEVYYFWNLKSSILLVEIRSVWYGKFAAFSLGVTSSQLTNDTAFFDELLRFLKEKGYLFFQLEPLDGNDDIIDRFPILQRKAPFPYKHFLTPHTRQLNLSLSEDELLQAMHEKWRYNIRLAQKRWVIVQSVEGNEKNIDIWMSLLTETTNRDSFHHNKREYYETFISLIKKNNSWELLFAEYQGHIIAAMIVVYTETRAIYYYGASISDRELRKHMAPYLLQWHAITEAKKRQIPLYDFLGVADPENTKDSLISVSEFKEKFGWKVVKLPMKSCIMLSWMWAIFLLFRSLSQR